MAPPESEEGVETKRKPRPPRRRNNNGKKPRNNNNTDGEKVNEEKLDSVTTNDVKQNGNSGNNSTNEAENGDAKPKSRNSNNKNRNKKNQKARGKDTAQESNAKPNSRDSNNHKTRSSNSGEAGGKQEAASTNENPKSRNNNHRNNSNRNRNKKNEKAGGKHEAEGTDAKPNKKQRKGSRAGRRDFKSGPKVEQEPEPMEGVELTASTPPTTSPHITDKRFDDLQIHADSKRAMREVFKYEFMTVVQAETLPVILQSKDVLARAKTGTGKTLAFLIPSVELLLGKKPSNDISSLVLSPTRELAFQIQKEAESLTRFHRNIRSVACVGGTNIGRDHRALKQSVQILVATPGRLLDHLQNFDLAKRMDNLEILIFDECDQLLDQGFRPDILRILKLLEPSKARRQTLLFSATVPDSVSEIAEIALLPEYEYIDTVGDDEDHTHLHVQQDLMVCPQAEQLHAIESLLTREVQSGHYKIIVFFTTARLTGFMADLFRNLGPVLEIHSRKSQAMRKKASDKFRDAKNAILFSSDVSARGMDYPDVTMVLQVGLTERAQYIHRLGRTARAGKQGKGTLLLSPYEEPWMTKQLQDLPLQKCEVPVQQDYKLDATIEDLEKSVIVSGEQAYRAWLGFYNSHLKKMKWDKDDLVDHANQWYKEVGLKEQPSLQKKTIGKMGLKGVRGLRIQ